MPIDSSDLSTSNRLISFLHQFHNLTRNHKPGEVKGLLDKMQTVLSGPAESSFRVMETIITITCEHYCTTEKKIRSQAQSQPLPEARRTAFILITKHTKISKSRIADHFNSSRMKVIRACQHFHKLNPDLKTDREFITLLDKLEQKIKSIHPSI